MDLDDLDQQAVTLIAQERYQDAIALYRQCLTDNPSQPSNYWYLGLALLLNGQEAEAQDVWLSALLEGSAEQIEADRTDLLNVLFEAGKQALDAGKLSVAKVIFLQVLELEPEHYESYRHLGMVLEESKDLEGAITCYQQAICLHPDLPDAHNNLGVVLQSRADVEGAIACFQNAIEVDCSFYKAYYNLGSLLMGQGRLAESVNSLQRALTLKPALPEAHNNLSIVLQYQGRLSEAFQHHQQALALKPNFPEAYTNLASTFMRQGLYSEAEAAYRKALDLKPELAHVHSNLLLAQLYNPDTRSPQILTEACTWATQHAAKLMVPDSFTNNCDPNRRLKIGYVSPDFRTHSVAYFIEAILAHHHKLSFETFCYSQVTLPDAATDRLAGMADHWCSIVGMSDRQLADQIRADGIDILVDLAGHTRGNRLLVFARKPAPIQITYLGYPSTTGLSQIDYRLTDAYADPPQQGDEYYTEQLLRLPSCFLCYTPPEWVPAVAALPALRNGYVTFGSFNNLAKVTPQVISLWSQILAALPNSRLLLKNLALRDEGVRTRYLELLAGHGIERDRIHLAEHKDSPQDHLNDYANVDIGLDTFPYNGTTTTCEALWMGVPVITLAGRTHVARVGVSLLSAVGLEPLIATTPEDYVAKAITLASHLEQLAQMRSTLRQYVAASSLCDGPTFVRELEDTYRQLWQRWCASQP
jgi:predicted O-linked N-acetylglucosamine transferase (SPINDLY family)